jgi:uncharacterized protein (TIGR02145 family)
MKTTKFLKYFFLIGVFFIFNCKKSQEPPVTPTDLKLAVVSQTEIDLAWKDNSSNENGFKIERSLNVASGWAEITSTTANVILFKNTDLTPVTNYFYRLRAFNSVGNSEYSNLTNSTTLPPNTIPVLTTTAVSSITINSAGAGGNITADGGVPVIARGVCWSTTANPTISNSFTSDGTGSGTFTSSISGLTPGTIYYIRAYATNSVGTSYGNEINFTTQNPTYVAPAVTSSAATLVTNTSATLNGSVNANGSSTTVTFEYGTTFVYGSTINTTPGTVTGITPTTVSGALTGLIPGQLYHFRVKAVSAGGTVYSDDLTFNTTQPPTATTQDATNFTQTTVTLNGQVNANGLASVITFEYGLTTGYGSSVSGLPDNATGSVNTPTKADITGLTQNTTYHFRIKAVSSAGATYGADLTFSTSAPSIVVPTLTTTAVTSVIASAATSGGNITSDGGASVTMRGVCWSTSANPTIANSKSTDGSGNGVFTSSLISLSASTQYYVRAYATNSAGTGYGDQVTFTTAATDPVVATLTTAAVSAITSSTATGGGNITSDGGGAVTSRGICFGTTSNPTLNDSKTINGSGTGAFTSPFTGLIPSTLYHVRAYATNAAGTAYGNDVTFTSSAPDAVLPDVTTSAVSGITVSSATGSGNVTSDGGGTVTVRGVCWNISGNPTTSDSKTTDGTGTGLFTSSITGLTASTIYYVRAYATNSAGTAYGNQVSFATSDPAPLLPTLTTTAITGISSSSATSGGNITGDGGAGITVRGVCWSISSNPTTSDSKTGDGSGIGIFSSNLSGLSANTLYYIRAYATNSSGTAYGNQVTFTTSLPDPILPTVTTAAITAITHITATCGGNVTADGYATVTARGVCWSTSINPTIADAKTTDGTGTGAFSSPITGLAASTVYYARAYATNSVGTAYGNQVTFTSAVLPYVLPALITTAASAITYNSASTGGNISSDGGATVTTRGVCYGISSNPTINNNLTSDGTGTGAFISSLTGLSGSTLYYVRAYATNAAGTAYGTQVSFTTSVPPPDLPVISTTAISGIASTIASSGGNITDPGLTSVTARGVCWSATSNPTTANSKTVDGSGAGAFSSSITILTPCTTYHVRAYATNSAGTSYGADLPFTTGTVLPSITTTAISGIASTTASSGGNITGDCMTAVSARGVCWSTSAGPTTALTTKTTDGTGGGSYSSSITGLTPCTLYYVRSYATNSAGTVYGNEITFTSSSALPTITTTTISAIGSTTASSGGTVTGNCLTDITARGVCWSTSSGPTVALSTKTTDGTGGGAFSSSLTGLTPCTTYYVRAYSTNGAGTAYGNEVAFTTSTVLPTLTTTAIYGITSSAGSSGGTISGDCINGVTAKGICWNTTGSPTTANALTYNGTGGGAYGSNMTGLTQVTTYYVRAYATNAAGTAYGNEVSFTTLPNMPSVSTSAITIFSSTAANAGGTVTADGGAVVSAYGVCWNTSSYPTIANSITTNGSGTGSFSSNVTGLTAGTLYYVRAYATNSAGTAYGTNVGFTTPAQLTDIDANVYPTVSINGQVWMQQNLKVTRWEDGTSLVLYSDTSSVGWGYYHSYLNTAANLTNYGYLYNSYVIGNTKDICPTGWHVPTITDWSTLATNLGGYSVAGGKMNDLAGRRFFIIGGGSYVSYYYWNNLISGHDNSSLFYGRGGGDYFTTYGEITNATIWWTITSNRYIRIDYNSTVLQGIGSVLTDGGDPSFYIRCKKD